MPRVSRTSRRITSVLLFVFAPFFSSPASAAPPKTKPAAAAPSQDEAARKEAQRLVQEAEHLLEKKEYDAALVPAEKALAMREKTDPDGALLKMSLYQVARIHEKKGNYAAATPYLERRLKLTEKSASNEAELLFAIEAVADSMLRAGDNERSIAMSERALVVAIKLDRGKEGEHATRSVSRIAKAQKALRRYDAAEASFLRAIKIEESLDRPQGLHWLMIDLGEFYFDLGNYARAEAMLTRGSDVQARALTRANSTSTMLKVARARMALEDWPSAEILLDEVLRIAQGDGEGSSFFAVALIFRGSLDIETGAYDKARPLLERAAKILEMPEVKGEKDTRALNAVLAGLLGRLSMLEGDYGRAEAFLGRAQVFFEKNGKPTEKAEIASSFAELYSRAKRFERAEKYALEAMAIRDVELFETHPAKAESRAALAHIREARGDAKGARKLHEEALVKREAAFGKEHPFVGRSLLELADLDRRQGRFEDAEALYKRAIGIFEKNFGPEYERVAAALEGLSALYAAKGKLDLAVRTATGAAEIREKQAALVVAAGSEAQKRAFVATMSAGSDWIASLHARIAPTDERAKNLALQTILQRKGRVLDVMASSIAALRRTLSAEDAALFDELVAARADVAKLAMRGPAGVPLDTFRAELSKREAKAHAIEDKLGRRGGVLAAEQIPVTIPRVQALLPDDAVMIELSLYSPRRSVDMDMPSVEGPPRISVYLLDSKGNVSFVDLGESAPIEAATKALRNALGSIRQSDPKPQARALDALVMQKIRPLLGGKKQLLISADGALSLVPFAALVDEAGQYLVENFEISYLTSGRDLLRLAHRSPSGRGSLIVADPAFGSRAKVGSALELLAESPSEGQEDQTRGLEKAFFPPLPATAAEARAIAALLPKSDVRVDIEATEPVLKQMQAPRILHIATHGFFLSARKPPAAAPGLKDKAERGLELDLTESNDWLPDDPLLRSGIALSGANAKNGGGGEDGILTALEASSLNLWGTKLVVLSACETGLGDVFRGEGVIGLRRALFLAGTETLVASLWQVADEETKTLMVGYYGRVQQGGARGASLRDQQLAMLHAPKTAHPYYWASFGVFGDSSPMGPEAEDETKTEKAVHSLPAPSSGNPKITMTARGCACALVGEAGEDETSASFSSLFGLLAFGLALGRRKAKQA